MSAEVKYQPEDIEFFLLNKEYGELSAAELEFVSEFIQTEEEYTLMRGTMMGIAETVHPEVEVVAPYAIKDALMAEFEKKGNRAAGWWSQLTGFLFPSGRSLIAKPGIQIGVLTSLALVVAFVIPWGGFEQENGLAYQQELNRPQEESTVIDEEANNKLTIEGKDSESLMQNQFSDNDKLLRESGDVKGGIAFSTDSGLNRDMTSRTSTDLAYANGLSDSIRSGVGLDFGYDKNLPADDLVFADEVAEHQLKSEDASLGFVADSAHYTGFELTDELTDQPNTGAVSGNIATVAPTTESTSMFDQSVTLNEVADLKTKASRANKKLKLAEAEKKDELRKEERNANDNTGRYLDLPKASRALSEDEELIGIFYTAM